MTTSSKKESTPLFTSAQAYAVKTPPRKVKKSTDLGTELQARLRKAHALYLADQQHKKTIAAAYTKIKDEFAVYMEINNIDELHCIGTQFSLQLRHTNHWTFSDDIKDLAKNLADAKDKEKDNGIAINEPTSYSYPLISREAS